MKLYNAINYLILSTITTCVYPFPPYKKATSHRPMNTRLSIHQGWARTPKKYPQCEDTYSFQYTNVVAIINKYLSKNRQLSESSLEKTIREAADEATGVINMRKMKKINEQELNELSSHKSILIDFLNQEPIEQSNYSWEKEFEDLHVNQVMDDFRNLK